MNSEENQGFLGRFLRFLTLLVLICYTYSIQQKHYCTPYNTLETIENHVRHTIQYFEVYNSGRVKIFNFNWSTTFNILTPLLGCMYFCLDLVTVTGNEQMCIDHVLSTFPSMS